MNKIVVGSDGNSAYSVTDGTRNITITGLNFTLEAIHVGYIFNITQNLLLFAPINNFPGITVSGGVVTYDSSKAELASGDILHIQLFPPNYGKDADGVRFVYVTNPEYAHNAGPEVLVEEEDQIVDTVNRYVIPFVDYTNMGLYIKLFADTADDQVVLTVWATNDADADDSADDGWADVSQDVLGAASMDCSNETLEEFHWIDTDMPCLKYMIKLVYGQSSSGITENNSADVIIFKA